MDRADLTSIRWALIAGSRFPASLRLQFTKYLPKASIYNCYGPTEATIYCLVCNLNDFGGTYFEKDTISVGKAIPGCIPLIIDEYGDPVEKFEEGELLIGGIQVMDCYVNNPTATDASIIEVDGIRYYKTGDLAFFNNEGEYFVTGRNDDTIKVSGQRVNLSDIDSYVQECDFVEFCATVAVEDKLRGSSIILFILPNRDIKKDEALIKLRKVLPSHQVPQDIVFIKELPLNNSGKICKHTLKKTYQTII